MRVRDLEVIAEDLVEADLHARDAGPLAFGGLILGHPLLAAGSQLAKLVDIGAIAVADEVAVARGERASSTSACSSGPRISAHRSSRDSMSRSSAPVRPVSFALTFGRQASVRPTNAKIARRGPAGRNARQQPLDIVNLPKRFAELARDRRVRDQFVDGIDAGVDGCDIGQRRREPIGQKPCAETRHRAVEHSEQRAFAFAVAERGDQFQAAARRWIDRQPFVGRIRQKLIDVSERRLLRFGQIVEHRAGGSQRGRIRGVRLVVKTEALERMGAEVLGERFDRRRATKRPRGATGDRCAIGPARRAAARESSLVSSSDG